MPTFSSSTGEQTRSLQPDQPNYQKKEIYICVCVYVYRVIGVSGGEGRSGNK